MTFLIQSTLFRTAHPLVCFTSNSCSNVTTSHKRFTSSDASKKDGEDLMEKKKPNLRQAGQNKNKTVVIVACLLAACYMYPMIFRPLFFGDSIVKDEKQEENLKALLQKHRPSNMPEWTSPFAPKTED